MSAGAVYCCGGLNQSQTGDDLASRMMVGPLRQLARLQWLQQLLLLGLLQLVAVVAVGSWEQPTEFR